MLFDPLHNAIVSIRSLMIAFQSLESRIFRYLQCHSILHSKLLKLAHNAIRDVRDAFSKQAVHTCLEDVELILDGKVDEVGIDDDPIRWSKCVIMREKQTRRFFWSNLSISVQFFDFNIVGSLLGHDLLTLSIMFLLLRLVLFAC